MPNKLNPHAQADAMAALRRSIAHAARHVPFYRDQSWAARLRAGLELKVADIPITSKESVRSASAAFRSDFVPPEAGEVIEKHTSGSTGISLCVPKTARHFAINAEENDRLRIGWGFERHRRRVSSTNPEEPGTEDQIETVEGPRGTTWTIYSFNSRAVADLVAQVRPTMLSARPNVVRGALLERPEINFLKLVSTVSEAIPADLPALIARNRGCLHFDLYGTVETGLLAALCKKCGRYHIANRHVLFELLDDDGLPVAPGEMGRVVVTPLFNLAMPLMRYDIGDYAVRARRDACDGSGLALKKIVGRRRDLFKLPDGSKVIPYPLGDTLAEAGIVQCKLVQTSLADVEFRYVAADPGTEVDPAVAQRIVDRAVSPLLRAIPVKVAELPVRANAKYVMHESLI